MAKPIKEFAENRARYHANASSLCCCSMSLPYGGYIGRSAFLQGNEEARLGVPWIEQQAGITRERMGVPPGKTIPINKKALRKPYKAEAKAQEMLRELIGFDQWRIYRATSRLLVNATNQWLIGNLFGHYNKLHPLNHKPDVARIDGKRLGRSGFHATTFCIDPVHVGEQIPYTDKVLTFASNCLWDEVEFKKTGNRIREMNFNELPRCGVFNLR